MAVTIQVKRAISRSYTAEEYNRAMELRREKGLSAGKIAKMLGFNDGAVSHWIHDGKKPKAMREKRAPYNERGVDSVTELLRMGKSINTVIRETGTSKVIVLRVLRGLLDQEDLPIVNEVLACMGRGMSIGQVMNALSLDRSVVEAVLVLQKVKVDVNFDRVKFADELGEKSIGIKHIANRILKARSELFPLVACDRCGKKIRKNELQILAESNDVCGECREELENLLGAISDLNCAFMGRIVRHHSERYGGGQTTAEVGRSCYFDEAKNTEQWKALVARMNFKEEK
jgi:predicted transcriptional regulator